ncbi:unnamed protein product [Urochloa humidicola]
MARKSTIYIERRYNEFVLELVFRHTPKVQELAAQQEARNCHLGHGNRNRWVVKAHSSKRGRRPAGTNAQRFADVKGIAADVVELGDNHRIDVEQLPDSA